MRELNENCVYSLEELTSEELKELSLVIEEANPDKRYLKTESWLKSFSETGYKLLFRREIGWSFERLEEDFINAKELFYTLENVQVDCSGLSEEQIKEMADVFEVNGYKIWEDDDAFKIKNNYTYLRINWSNEFYINGESYEFTTITYEKFMELFTPQYEVKMIVEAPKNQITDVGKMVDKPKHYSNGIDTFERMEANCTLEECLAFAKGNIDKYNFRTKGQDLEDYTKIIAYANWAIKLLNKK